MKYPLVIGRHGQMAQAYRRVYPEAYFLSSRDVNLRNLDQLPLVLDQQLQKARHSGIHPDVVLNFGAYTQVDQAEEAADEAFLINGEAPGVLAHWCHKHDLSLIHLSTDYVFSGQGEQPWMEKDPLRPINVYGRSKALGEERIQDSPLKRFLILRTSWIYSPFGSNFFLTLLRLLRERSHVDVVNDQWGSPTYALDLASMIREIQDQWKTRHQNLSGVFHLAHQGYCTWWDFAQAIKEISASTCQVSPIASANFPRKAIRPTNSRLNTTQIQETFALRIPSWTEGLSRCWSTYKKERSSVHQQHD